MLKEICDYLKRFFNMQQIISSAPMPMVQHENYNTLEEKEAHRPNNTPVPQDVAQKTIQMQQMAARQGIYVEPWAGAVDALLQRQQPPPPQLPQPYNIPFQQNVQQNPSPVAQVPNMEFEIMGVKVKIENGKIMKQEWIDADTNTHKVVEGKILELQWKEIQK